MAAPNDYLWPELWDRKLVKADEAWDKLEVFFASELYKKYGDPKIILAVVDFGMQTFGGQVLSPDFQGNVDDGSTSGISKLYAIRNFHDIGATSNDDSATFHGVQVAGVALSPVNENIGVVGVAPNIRFMDLHYKENAQIIPTELERGAQLLWAAGINAQPTPTFWSPFPNQILPGADILSVSISIEGGSVLSDDGKLILEKISRIGRNGRGALLFMAAGNEGQDVSLNQPYGTFERVFCVGAITFNPVTFSPTLYTLSLASYTNFSDKLSFCTPSSNFFNNENLHNPDTGYYGIYTNDLPDRGNMSDTNQLEVLLTQAISAGEFIDLKADVLVGDTTIKVKTTSGANPNFALLGYTVGTYILLEHHNAGRENYEWLKIHPTIAPTGDTITLDSTTLPAFDHLLSTQASNGMVFKGTVLFVDGNTIDNSVISNAPYVTLGEPGDPDYESVRIREADTSSSPYKLYVATPLSAHPIGTKVASGLFNYNNTFGGTSSATPLASGVGALVLTANPNLTWAEVGWILKFTADRTVDSGHIDWKQLSSVNQFNKYYGYGMLNAKAAVILATTYSHNDRDLIIRDHEGDVGTVYTDVNVTPINSPDIWLRNTNEDENTPGWNDIFENIDNKNPDKNVDRYIYGRIINRGNVYDSLEAYARVYVALSDGAPASPATTPFFFSMDGQALPTEMNIAYSTNISTISSGNPGVYFIDEVPLHTEADVSSATFTPLVGISKSLGAKVAKVKWDASLIPPVSTNLKTYLIVEVTPHDGAFIGDINTDRNASERNNNFTFKEIAFAKTGFKNPGGSGQLPNLQDVDQYGTLVNIPFTLDVEIEIGNYVTEKVSVELIREFEDGTQEKAIFSYGTSWQLTYVNSVLTNWANVLTPVLYSTTTPASGQQTHISFDGDLSASNAYKKVFIKTKIQSTTAVTTIAEDVYEINLVVPTVAPQGYNPAKTEELVPESYAFADMASLTQIQANSYGPDPTNNPNTVFKITSGFTNTTDINAYAICDGDVIIQRSPTDNDRINLIIRPRKQPIQGFTPIKYIVYRGLRLDDFINPSTLSSAEIEVTAQASTNSEFIASLYPTHIAQNPSLPFLATGLGYDPSSQADTDELDKFFLESNPDFQYVPVSKGMQIGRFWSDGGNNVFGLEIMMFDGPFKPTFKYTRESEFKIDITLITGTSPQDEFLKKTERDKILSFIDPASFYGLHIVKGDKGKVDVRDLSSPPNSLSYKTAQDIFDNVVSKFYSKNDVYIDIRNEIGRSYNFFENYDGQVSSVDSGMQLQIGTQYTDDTTNNLVAKEYKIEVASTTYSWPILVIQSNQATSNVYNDLYVKLRIDDNVKPVLFLENIELSLPIGGNFIDETYLVPTTTNPPYSNVLGLKVPNVNGSSNKDFASRLIKLRYKRKIDATTPWHPNTKSLKSEHYLDNLFYNFDEQNIWALQSKNEWVHSYEKRYVDGSAPIGVLNTAETGVAFESISSTPNRYILYTNASELQEVGTGSGKLNRGVGSGTDNEAENINEAKKLFNYNLAYNLLDESSTPITALAFYPDEKENIAASNTLTVGISESDKTSLLACATTLGLSNLFPKHIKFQSLGNFTDANGTSYDKYKLGVHGLKDDGTYGVDYPSPDIHAYTVDKLSHVTLAFSSLQGDPPKINDNTEEARICNTSNSTSAIATAIIATDSVMNGFVTAFQSGLNGISTSATDSSQKAQMKTIIETKALQVFNQAVARNQSGASNTNDDRPLYWARLKMACILKTFMNSRPKLRDTGLVKLLYTRSRGRNTVNFGSLPATTKKVLITGFDPFSLGSNPKQSNPSGAAALYLHDKSFTYGGKTAKIQCALFPVRYDEFDSGDVERFFDKYLTGPDKVDMIITLSQGSPSQYDVERFAAKYRNPNHDDNEGRKGKSAFFYLPQSTTVGDIGSAGMMSLPEFIETTLPKAKMVPGTFSANALTYFNQAWVATNDSEDYTSHTDSSLYSHIPGTRISREGSGGDYLSNEIFYRVALLRTKRATSTKTGHLHIPKIQSAGDIPFSATQTLVINVENMIRDAISGL